MKKSKIVVILIVLVPLGFLLFFGKALSHKFRTLPYYHPSELFLDSVDNVLGQDYVIPDFSFMNHDGTVVTRNGFEDAVYLMIPVSMESEFLNKITEKLLSINFKYKVESDIKIYCLNTSDLETSKAAVEEYMVQINTNFDNSENFYVLSSESSEEMKRFIQNGLGIEQLEDSPYTVLIDPNGQIRGRYHLRIESHVTDAMEDIALLRKEISLGKYKEKKSNENNH